MTQLIISIVNLVRFGFDLINQPAQFSTVPSRTLEKFFGCGRTTPSD
jgi:hypothetical protein